MQTSKTSQVSRPIALVTARAARNLDEDLPPLVVALTTLGRAVEVIDWDDITVDWTRFAMAVLRSTWDYTDRLPEFLAWLERAASQTLLHNPLAVVRWNVDKHYLTELARNDCATVPSEFVEPGESGVVALQMFLRRYSNPEIVIKPAIGAGSRDAQRYDRDDQPAMLAHMSRLLERRRSVLLQPYLDRVDEQGETALMFFDGQFSHAIRKGPLLHRGSGPTRALFASETITPRIPGDDELRLTKQVLKSLPFAMPLYARIDLIRAPNGTPCVLELELAEPSLFFQYSEGSAMRLAELLVARSSL